MTEHRELTVREAGRMGGEIVKKKYGSGYYKRIGAVGNEAYKELLGGPEELSQRMSEIGKLGGEAAVREHGPEHHVSIGKEGGVTTRNRYGSEHYSRIGKMHGRKYKESQAEKKGSNRFPTP